jgi:FkbM family methyltransferase
MSAKGYGRTAINAIAGLVGARVVNEKWGPRGFRASLEKIRTTGISPTTIIDVGASNGQWTRECLTVFPESRYFLIDPLDENRPALTQLSHFNSRIEFWSGALGATAGVLELWAHGDQSSLLPSHDFAGARRAVEVRTLDSFVKSMKLEPAMLLKADVQGFELEVLKGATRCLEMTELLLIEISFRRVYDNCPLAHDVIAFLGARHFRIYDICSFLQRASDNELVQCDMVFAREDSKLFAHEGWR